MTFALTLFALCLAGGGWAARRAVRAQPGDDAGWSAHLVTIGREASAVAELPSRRAP